VLRKLCLLPSSDQGGGLPISERICWMHFILQVSAPCTAVLSEMFSKHQMDFFQESGCELVTTVFGVIPSWSSETGRRFGITNIMAVSPGGPGNNSHSSGDSQLQFIRTQSALLFATPSLAFVSFLFGVLFNPEEGSGRISTIGCIRRCNPDYCSLHECAGNCCMCPAATLDIGTVQAYPFQCLGDLTGQVDILQHSYKAVCLTECKCYLL
jgi:hypothetical protein